MDSYTKDIISENINFYMAKYGESVQDLAKYFGVSEDVVHLWMVGSRMPNKRNLQKMLNHFYTDEFSFKNVRNHISSKGFGYTPLINKLKFGQHTTAVINIDKYIPTIERQKYMGNQFYIKKFRDDMTPTIFPNSLVLIYDIENIEEIKNGEIVAVVDKNSYYIRCFYQEDSTIILTADNKDFRPIVFNNNDEYKLAGKVIKIVRDLD